MTRGTGRRCLVFLAFALGSAPARASLPPDGIQLTVTRGPVAGQVSMAWDTGPFTFSVHRSTVASTILDPGNLVGTTTNHSFVDTPPAGSIFFYEVTSPCTTFHPPEVCDGVDDDCDGTVDGAPATAACAAPNSTAVCTGGACVLTCFQGFEDCDDNVKTGCEAFPATDFENCGSCGHACPLSGICGTGASCLAGACLPIQGVGEGFCGTDGDDLPPTTPCFVRTLSGFNAIPPTTDAGLVPDGDVGMYVAAGTTVLALEADTGLTRWPVTLAGTVSALSTPAVLSTCEHALFATTSAGTLYNIDGTNGTIVSLVETKRPVCADSVSASPIVQVRSASNPEFQNAVPFDLVMVITTDGCGDLTRNRVIAYRADALVKQWELNGNRAFSIGGGIAGCTLDYATNSLFCGTSLPPHRFQNTLWSIHTTDGSVRWSVNAGSIVSRPVLANGRVYAVTSGGALVAVDPDTGSVIWRYPFSSTPGTARLWAEARPPYAGLLLVTDASGALSAIVDTGSRAVRGWRNTSKFFEGLAATPAFGKVYVGQDDGKVGQVNLASGEYEASRLVLSGFGVTFPAPLLTGDLDGSAPNALTAVAAAGTTLVVSELPLPWQIGSSLAPPSACSNDAECVAAGPTLPCAVRHCRLNPGATNGACVSDPVPDGTVCNDSLACTTTGSCRAGICVPGDASACACSVAGDAACTVGNECCGAAIGCRKLATDTTDCGACGNACLPGQICSNGVCLRDATACDKAPDAAVLGALNATSLLGASALAYDPKNCNAVLSIYPSSGAGKIVRVTTSSSVLTTTATVSPSPENGVEVSPDGNLLFGTVANHVSGGSTITPRLHFVEVSPAVNTVPLTAGFTFSNLPFTTNQYNQGPVGPAFDLKTFTGTSFSPLRVYEANWFGNGDVIRLNGTFSGSYTFTATPTPIFTTASRITALGYGIRPALPSYGALWIGSGTTLTVFCSTDTNGGATCPSGATATLDLLSTDVYGGVQRIYALATDPLYGDAYVIVKNSAGTQELLLVRGDDLSVRRLSDVQIDWHVAATPATFTTERRVALIGGRLMMIMPPTSIGGKPAFVETTTAP